MASNALGRPGIAVDTHVGRLARRLKFSRHDDPDKVEADLESLFPEAHWTFLHRALILHGRRVCHARGPVCDACRLAADACGSFRPIVSSSTHIKDSTMPPIAGLSRCFSIVAIAALVSSPNVQGCCDDFD